MLLLTGQRRSKHLQRRLQAMADDERYGANVELREGMGLVLLDLGHGKFGAMELEGRHAGRHFAAEDME